MNVLDGSPSGLQEDAAVARSNSSVERGGVSPQEKRDVSTTTYNEEPKQKPAIGAQTWLSLVGGFVVIFFVAAAAGLWLREPITNLGTAAVEGLGLAGLIGFVLAVDSLPTPFSYAPMMLLAVQGGMSIWLVFITCSLASMAAGLLGYGIGRLVGMPERAERWLSNRYPQQLQLLKTHGTWGVFIAGALPMPFAIGTWTAGAMGARLVPVALACLVRIPKTGIYLSLIAGGLSLGGSL